MLLIAAGVLGIITLIMSIVLIVNAFKVSAGQGLLSLFIPLYIFYFAFARYASPRKTAVLATWLIAMVGGVTCEVLFIRQATAAIASAFAEGMKDAAKNGDFKDLKTIDLDAKLKEAGFKLAAAGNDAKPSIPSPTPSNAAPQKPADFGKLQAYVPRGWSKDYNQILSSWTFEKLAKGKKGQSSWNRLYVDAVPEEAPNSPDAYASKLQEKDWQDIGFQYTEISEKRVVPGGFLVKGLVKDSSEPKSKPGLGFVMIRNTGKGTIRCKSGSLANEAGLKEALDLCESVRF
jgi:hypothetical protein